MEDYDPPFMRLAIETAGRCEGKAEDPRVGAVAVLDGQVIGTAFRGEKKAGDHAEFTLLEHYLSNQVLAGATIYTTLEPCTVRNPTKIPCVHRLLDRRVGRVVIGMLDPNPLVRGLGFQLLRKANIVTELFPPHLMAQIEELNRDFIRNIESDPIHIATQEIAVLATRAGIVRQKEAMHETLKRGLESLREINKGHIRIPGREDGYLNRFLKQIDSIDTVQCVKAFIRLSAFEPHELLNTTWFETFYNRLSEACKTNKLIIHYIFLIRTPSPVGEVADFIDRYKLFAASIRTIWQSDPRVTQDILRPSVILWEDQMIAFTHDRGDDSTLIEASEWITKEDFTRLQERYKRIEVISNPYYSNPSGS